MDLLFETKSSDMRPRAGALIESLFNYHNYLDAAGGDADLEEEGDRGEVGDDQPSLGSFDRMTNQEKSWRTRSLWPFPAVDGEVDDCDR